MFTAGVQCSKCKKPIQGIKYKLLCAKCAGKAIK